MEKLLGECIAYIRKISFEDHLDFKEDEIKIIAMMYANELESKTGQSNFIADDKILKETLKSFYARYGYDANMKPDDVDPGAVRTQYDKERNSRGGYGYNDSYDDHGLDEGTGRGM